MIIGHCSSIIDRRSSSIIDHRSSIIIDHPRSSSIIDHQSSIIDHHRSSIIAHQSSIIDHHHHHDKPESNRHNKNIQTQSDRQSRSGFRTPERRKGIPQGAQGGVPKPKRPAIQIWPQTDPEEGSPGSLRGSPGRPQGARAAQTGPGAPKEPGGAGSSELARR